MAYDGQGRRVSITEQHGTTVLTAKRFVWCRGELCQERDSSGSTVQKQFFGAGERINGLNYYFVKDHLGNIREMTDSGGTLRANYDYDCWGRQTKIAGDLDADFGYASFYVEKTANLDLTLFRAYDANKGRWLNRDPIGIKGGMNIYEYANNNSLENIDYWGLCCANKFDQCNFSNFFWPKLWENISDFTIPVVNFDSNDFQDISDAGSIAIKQAAINYAINSALVVPLRSPYFRFIYGSSELAEVYGAAFLALLLFDAELLRTLGQQAACLGLI